MAYEANFNGKRFVSSFPFHKKILFSNWDFPTIMDPNPFNNNLTIFLNRMSLDSQTSKNGNFSEYRKSGKWVFEFSK